MSEPTCPKCKAKTEWIVDMPNQRYSGQIDKLGITARAGCSWRVRHCTNPECGYLEWFLKYGT